MRTHRITRLSFLPVLVTLFTSGPVATFAAVTVPAPLLPLPDEAQMR